ncbi:NACHT domain-containing protein [Vacuolonema iberomarrocanum]|uniref:NACHT domain-containing protein n=1 Tax=Vacuolonema iberomarrocanum TaxID=3454632 RepID=UPI0019E8BD2F|nr:NACHT domain-containing NTPase [filamentous cyanobacterium LEGE 07170]
MAGRSLRASAEGIQIIRKAIKRGGWTLDALKDALGWKTKQPIIRLLHREPIDRDSVEKLCHFLGLAVEDVATLDTKVFLQRDDLEALVQQMRDRIRPLIQAQCSTVHMLDMGRPIDLEAIYTPINVLEKLTARRGWDPEDLAQMPLGSVERFSLDRITEDRVLGLQAVEQNSKLVVLGKPGAGKTIFLKHLAMQCLSGAFQAHRVPLFVSLKEFVEAEGQPNLLTYLEHLISPGDELQLSAFTTMQTAHPLRSLLVQGRGFILLDGLDGVPNDQTSRVLYQIKQFSEHYPRNAIVMTCRIAACDATLKSFTEVEIADFDQTQIAEASRKWFRYNQVQEKTKPFLKVLRTHSRIRDLASRPLLLVLLCLVFNDSGKFPANRAELYATSINVLLKKWNIQPRQVHKPLSLHREEDLLSQLALRTFEANHYFFKQSNLEQHIQAFIQHLPGASTDAQTLERDSQIVLKSIEAQHGLLIERAHGIYSFSHLAFHEYFAAREIKEKLLLTFISQHVTERRWRDVLLLAVEMVPQADAVLQKIKQSVDGLLAEDEYLQQFLVWLREKSESTRASYKSAGIRAFYYSLGLDRALHLDLVRALDCTLDRALDLARALTHDLAFARTLTLARALDRALDRTLDRARARALALALALAHDRALDLARALALALARALDFDRARALDLALARDLDFALARALARTRDLAFDLDLDRALAFSLTRARDLARAHDRAIARDLVFALALALALARDLAQKDKDSGETQWSTLVNQLEHLRQQLPKDIQTREVLRQWWHDHGQAWVSQLQSTMIEHRNIGHDWQFSPAQRERLEKYYEANKLLVECLKSNCYVTRGVREEIENTLLLPIAEIERRKAQKPQR